MRIRIQDQHELHTNPDPDPGEQELYTKTRHTYWFMKVSVVDPDRYWIRIQEIAGSGSVF